ncbi:hypothetical protein L208DRAFT_1548052 [Tricholoma matsutake]|nr:hypothetical protein L208DRAFT_1548052 [Tricholoma matsutake 945]
MRHRLPADKMKIQSPAARDDVLVLLQREFDEDDIGGGKYSTDSSTDSSSGDSDDSDGSGASDSDDSDDEPRTKSGRKTKKKVRFSTKKVPAVPVVDTSTTSSIEILAKQMQELQLGQSRQIQELQQGQFNILRELAASRGMNTNIATQEQRCFICDKPNAHRLGIYNCPEVQLLTDEGLVMFTPDGRLVRANGGSLLRGVPGGGVAKALRDEKPVQASSSLNLKGKGREGHDPPPHMAAIAGLQSYGRDVLDSDTYGLASYATTRSQTKDGKKGNSTDWVTDRDNKAPTTGAPKPQVPTPRQQVPPVHPQTVNTTANPQPHPANTEETWRQHKNIPKPNPTGQPTERNKTEPPKPNNGYHFTSTIQEMIDGDAVQRKILDTMITLPLKEILGISPELQK